MTGDELRAAICAAPDDPAPRSVYADWLLEREDPRGAWMAIGHDELRATALWQRHGATWLREDLGTLPRQHAVYRGGFVEELDLPQELMSAAEAMPPHPLRTLRVVALRDLAELVGSCSSTRSGSDYSTRSARSNSSGFDDA